MDNDSKQAILDRYKYQIRTIHKLFEGDDEVGEVQFRLNDESTGTLKLLAIGGLILEALYEGQLLIIDELDKSLHPKLTRALINIFQNPRKNPNNAQLIFATHDVSLLDSIKFRRDQIWIVEKEFHGSSSIYSLSDIAGVRKDVPFDKWYLEGRFGGTPVINEFELDFEL